MMSQPRRAWSLRVLLVFVAALAFAGCSSDGSESHKTQVHRDGGSRLRDASGVDAADATPIDVASTDVTADTADLGEEDADADQRAQFLADDLEITTIQAFQTIETRLVEDGTTAGVDVPLIAGRDTLLRVSVTPTSSWTPREVTTEVQVTGPAGAQVLRDTMVVTQASTSSARDSAFEFRLSGAMLDATTAISARILGDGAIAVDEATASPARWPQDGSPYPLAASAATGELHVVLVPLRYDNDGSGRLPDTSDAQLARFEAALRALYPAHSVRLEVHDPVGWTGSVDWGDFNRELRALKQSDGADDAYYYGLIRPADTFAQYCGGSCTTGQSFTVSSAEATSYRVGTGLGFSGERWAWTLVHELGHMHGRGHAPCGVSWWSEDHSYPYGDGTVGVWGWDSRTDILFAPDEVTDFMGYCDNLWASDYTYLGLVERMRDVHAMQQPLALAPLRTWRYVNWSDERPPSWGRLTRERNPYSGEWATATFLASDGSALDRRRIPLVRYAHHGERSVLLPESSPRAVRVRVDSPSRSFELAVPAGDR